MLNSVYRFDDFELDCCAFELRRGVSLLRVDAVVLRLLETLLRHAGRVVTKEHLLTEVWGERVVADNALTVAITRLCKFFQGQGLPRESVLTVYGRGYRFTRPVSASEEIPPIVRVGSATSSTFVGRRPVMLKLEAVLAAALGGNGRLVQLRGEPGIGKTQVADMLCRHARANGCVVAWATCRENVTTPRLWPFIELLRSIASQNPAARLVCDSPELIRLLPNLVASIDDPAQAQTTRQSCREPGALHQTFDAISRALVDATAAMAMPLVLILDDLLSIAPRVVAAGARALHCSVPMISTCCFHPPSITSLRMHC
ncbi:MAG TPA: AAA family ATPase [Polyangiales bacterium]|nr:AAA family ATPase [Polyangiales bacterium]